MITMLSTERFHFVVGKRPQSVHKDSVPVEMNRLVKKVEYSGESDKFKVTLEGTEEFPIKLYIASREGCEWLESQKEDSE